MKNVLLIFCIMGTTWLNAQNPGGNQGRNGLQVRQDRQLSQQGNRGNPFRTQKGFNASKAVGVFYYDIDRAVKKLKLKDDKELAVNVTKTFNTYNLRMKDIEVNNENNFNEINIYMNTVVKHLQERGDRKKTDSVRAEVRQKMGPIRKAIRKENVWLNENLEALLNEKQLKKWEAYKKEINPIYGSENRKRNSTNINNNINKKYSQRDFGRKNVPGQNNLRTQGERRN